MEVSHIGKLLYFYTLNCFEDESFLKSRVIIHEMTMRVHTQLFFNQNFEVPSFSVFTIVPFNKHNSEFWFNWNLPIGAWNMVFKNFKYLFVYFAEWVMKLFLLFDNVKLTKPTNFFVSLTYFTTVKSMEMCKWYP